MNKIKDPISALTHFFGAVLAIPITIILIYNGIKNGTSWHVISFAIFGLSLFLLYSASTIYHTLKVSERICGILKKIDHMMIFVLIAGTYTPICLVTLNGWVGFSIFSVIWVLAIAGILLKAFWIDAPRHFSTSIYIFMGWLIVIASYPLFNKIPSIGILLLVLGGLSYTLGGVVYAFKWPKINSKNFGFHEIFHLFVLGGSFFHILLMFNYI